MRPRASLQWLFIVLATVSILVPAGAAYAQEETFLPIILGDGTGGNGGGGNCAIANLLEDPSFELGTPWTQITGGYPIVQEDTDALDGAKLAWFGGYNNANDRLVSKPFTVPDACTSLRIVLHLHLTTQEILNEPYDIFYASLQPAGDGENPEVIVADNTDKCSTCKWARYTYVYNEVPNRGQPLQLRFHGATDSSRTTNFMVDLVAVEASDTPFAVAAGAEGSWQREAGFMEPISAEPEIKE